MFRRLTATLTISTALVACGGDEAAEETPTVQATATASPTATAPPPAATDLRTLEGGAMSLRISAGAEKVLDYAGVRLSSTGEAEHGGRELTFPIRRGQLSVEPAGGAIELAGGLRISAGGDHVDATDLRLMPGDEVVTATVRGRRVPLLRFKLKYPRALPAEGNPFSARGTVSVVGDRALERLSSDFGVQVLEQGLPLGAIRLIAW
jgi:hypothetical protein